MIDKLNNSELLGKEKIEYMSQIRIIKKNLIHIQGIPKSLAVISLLKTDKYLGQYGKIIRFIMKYKINEENSRKSYSAYITYSNELEASLAILCIDSLLIEGKIIRAFFGTTKYCNHFLNHSKCPNMDDCIFLHQSITDKDIIIDNNDNNSFSYDEHLNLAKKIIVKSYLNINNIIENKKIIGKSIFPPIGFIFLNEEEKVKYLATKNIGYIKNINIMENKVILNNFNESKKNLISKADSFGNNHKKILLDTNNYAGNSSSNFIIKEKSKYSISNYLFEDKKNNPNLLSSMELYKIFQNSIEHILKAKPFYMALKNVELKKLEIEYFIKDLSNNGVDIYELLDGCLEPISDSL